jgi:predicted metal-dependent peptidase
MTKLTPEEKISRAIIRLNQGREQRGFDQPFFAHLMFRMYPSAMPEKDGRYWMRTAGVTPKGRLIYDRTWIDGLDDEKVAGLLMHEILHVALLHAFARDGRNPIIANIAQDIVVNNIVQRTGIPLPEGGVMVNLYDCNGKGACDLEFMGVKARIDNVNDKSWEEIYEELLPPFQKKMKEQQDDLKKALEKLQKAGKMPGFDMHLPEPQEGEGMPGGGQEGHGTDEGRGSSGMTKKEQEEFAKEMRDALVGAATAARQMGKLPGGMERIIDGILKPKVAWKSLLLKAVRPMFNPYDFSFRRPGRRSYPLGVFQPVMEKEFVDVVVQVDTSGSVGDEIMQQFVSEIVAIGRAFNMVRLRILFVDAAVQAEYVLDNASANKVLQLKPKGGGGTSMEAGLDYVKEKYRDASVVVVLTDGCDSWQRKARDYPFEVIWVICPSPIGITLTDAKSRIPYGVKIKMEE